MDKKNIKFGDTEIEKHKFHQHKRSISISNIDINKTEVSNEVSVIKKSVIGYKDGKKVRPLCIFFPEISEYERDFDETKYMSFFDKR